MIYLQPEFSDVFSAERTFSDFLRIPFECVREFKNRRTGRFERDGRGFYIKVHRPSGWWPIAEDVLRFRKPQSGAHSEWLTLQDVQLKGIPAPRPVAYGVCGTSSASQQSFVITEEIAPAISLEDLAGGRWEWPITPALKRRLVRSLAEIARALHTGGINHRDFYLGHFLLDISQGRAVLEQNKPKLFLIDLHRAQRRRRTPRRWLLKDLGGLLFSAMDAELTIRDLLLFVRCYRGDSSRAELKRNRRFWLAVVRRADKLYQKIHGRLPKAEISRLLSF
jgi:heptose I phosphotransferase